MPQMYSTDTTFHAPQNLIYALHNPSPTRPLFKIGNGNKESLRNLAEIFRQSNPPSVPPRFSVRGEFQDKLQYVNQ